MVYFYAQTPIFMHKFHATNEENLKTNRGGEWKRIGKQEEAAQRTEMNRGRQAGVDRGRRRERGGKGGRGGAGKGAREEEIRRDKEQHLEGEKNEREPKRWEEHRAN
eukprot:5592089-Pleurochrysis_carterae.AAC.1